MDRDSNLITESPAPEQQKRPDEPMSLVESKTSLIVNYLPQSMRERDLSQLFRRIGPLRSCKLMYDRQTGYSFGYGFVQYFEEDDAARAIQELNGMRIEQKVLKVSYSRPKSQDTKGSGLCIRNVPDNYDSDKLNVLFTQFGSVVQCRVIYDSNSGHSRGIAFIIMGRKCEAQKAIDELDGRVLPDGNTTCTPLAVQYIDNENRRGQVPLKYMQQRNMVQQLQQLVKLPALLAATHDHGDSTSNRRGTRFFEGGRTVDEHHQSYRYRDHSRRSNLKRLNDNKGPHHSKSYKSGGGDRNGYERSPSSDYSKKTHDKSNPNSVNPNNRLCSSLKLLYQGISSIANSSQLSCPIQLDDPFSAILKQTFNTIDPITGGYIIYVFGIGSDPDDRPLRELFEPFGEIARIDVIRDLATSKSKGYAFVTMTDYDQAVTAINGLNGCELNGRKLQVRFKG